MKIHLGSLNPTKLNATRNVFRDYERYRDAEVLGIDAGVEEFGHPKTIQETVEGAHRRAQAVFSDCDLSVGIESGLLVAPGTMSGYIETTICVVFDGSHYATGMGPGFEWPQDVLELILSGKDGSQALKITGKTTHEKVGKENGMYGILTDDRLDRTRANEIAIMSALAQFTKPEIYDA